MNRERTSFASVQRYARVAGILFVLTLVLAVLARAYASDILLLPMFLAGPSLMLWFLMKAVDAQGWHRQTDATQMLNQQQA